MAFHQPRSDAADGGPWFKVMNGGAYSAIHFSAVARHRERILHNHGQTLERLNERGGLDWYELWCAFNERALFPMVEINEAVMRKFVLDAVARERAGYEPR